MAIGVKTNNNTLILWFSIHTWNWIWFPLSSVLEPSNQTNHHNTNNKNSCTSHKWYDDKNTIGFNVRDINWRECTQDCNRSSLLNSYGWSWWCCQVLTIGGYCTLGWVGGKSAWYRTVKLSCNYSYSWTSLHTMLLVLLTFTDVCYSSHFIEQASTLW